MSEVYGFDAAGIRKIEEIVRRVLQSGFGKGGRRQRWPVPTPGGSKVIRFQFQEFTSGSDDTALCLVLASTDGSFVGETVEVVDATAELCFFGDETEGELVDRNGYAVLMRTGAGSQWEVFSLCCAPEGS